MSTMSVCQNVSCTASAPQEVTKSRFEQISLKKDFRNSLNTLDQRLATVLKVTLVAPLVLLALDGLMIAAEKIANTAINATNFVYRAFSSRTVEVMPAIVEEVVDSTAETVSVYSSTPSSLAELDVDFTDEEIVSLSDFYSIDVDETEAKEPEETAVVEAAPSLNKKWVAGATVVVAAVATIGLYYTTGFEFVTNAAEKIHEFFAANATANTSTQKNSDFIWGRL